MPRSRNLNDNYAPINQATRTLLPPIYKNKMAAVRLLPALSLKSRTAIATLIFILITAVLLTGASSVIVQSGMERIAGEQQAVLTAHIANDIDRKIAVRQNLLKQLAAEMPAANRADTTALREFLIAHRGLNPPFDNLSVLNRQGRQIVNLNYPESTLDASQREYFIHAMNSRQRSISMLLNGQISHRPVLIMQEPILDRNGAVELILLGTLNIERDHFLGELAALKIGKAGYSFLTSADGTYVIHTNKTYILKNALSLPGDNRALVRIIHGENGPFLAADNDGVEGIFTSRRLQSIAWNVTTFLPAHEVFGPVREIAYNALYLALLLMLIIGPLAWWYARYQLAPLQSLRERIQRGHDTLATGKIAYANNEIGALARAYDLLAAEKQLNQQTVTLEKERLRVTLQSIGDGVITTDTAGRITYLNPVAERMTGWPFGEAIGLPLRTVFDIVDEATGDIAIDPVDAVLRRSADDMPKQHKVLRQVGGARFTIADSAAPIRDANGVILGVVLVFHDVTEAQKLAAKISHRANHDALTGLVNRHEFEHRLARALDNAKQHDQQHTLLYLDLDQFKIVNDACGHEAGDELLRQLTMLLQTRLRKSDTLARVGGDEFAVLLEGSPPRPAEGVADTLRKTVKEFNFTWNNKIFPIGVSIGLLAIDHRSPTPQQVLAMADAACYIAKDMGRDQVHVYDAKEHDLLSMRRDTGWIERIRHALDENRLVLYSQKIVSLNARDAGVAQYELLLRMRDTDGKMLPPMAFIPAAERFGLMPEIDRWVIDTVLTGLTKAQANGGKRGRTDGGNRLSIYAINLSSATIYDDTFLPFLREAFVRFDVPPSRICFEISEACAIANLSKVTLLMRELKALGCQLALDDFCSGVSSFTSIRHLPIDYLKLDGTIVKEILEDPVRAAMLTAIRHVTHVLGGKLIAEQVGDPALLERLRDIGIDYVQGHVIESPIPWHPDETGQQQLDLMT
jgi:diguanylate cyclase (GGDEF)-like protein/PAS domain S-box-containing protein